MFLLYHSDRCNTSETVFHWCYINDLHTTHAVVCWVTTETYPRRNRGGKLPQILWEFIDRSQNLVMNITSLICHTITDWGQDGSSSKIRHQPARWKSYDGCFKRRYGGLRWWSWSSLRAIVKDIPNGYTSDVVLNRQAQVAHRWWSAMAWPGGPVSGGPWRISRKQELMADSWWLMHGGLAWCTRQSRTLHCIYPGTAMMPTLGAFIRRCGGVLEATNTHKIITGHLLLL
jgi:hypothetical protein